MMEINLDFFFFKKKNFEIAHFSASVVWTNLVFGYEVNNERSQTL